MELGLKQVAEIFGVAETKVISWIKNGNFPCIVVGDQYRFHRADLLEWAATRGQSFSPSIYAKVNGDLTPAGTHLTDALRLGGVKKNVTGEGLRGVLSAGLDGLPVPASLGVEGLVDLFLSRESVGSTAVGRGIAIPHPRQPILLTVPGAVMRLCYLSEPLEISTPDGIAVDKLFLTICQTVHEHLQLLARLSALLRVEAVQTALNKKACGDELFRVLRQAGNQFDEVTSDPLDLA